MNLVLWHGYLLADTGSNIFTREVVRALHRLGHSVTLLCQDPDGQERVGEAARVVRPEIGRDLPVFVVDGYPDLNARHVGDFSSTELDDYVQANGSAIGDAVAASRADFMIANHAVMGGPVARRGCDGSGTPYGVYVHGSELEYAIRGRPALAEMAREALDHAAVVLVGSAHTARVTGELLGQGPYLERVRYVPPGVDDHAFNPKRGSLQELVSLLRTRAGRNSRRDPRRSPDPEAADRLEDLGPFVLFAGKLMREKGVEELLGAWRDVHREQPDLTLVLVGFGPLRESLERSARGLPVVFTGAMSHDELQLLMPLAEVVVVPSRMAEAFGMIAAEAAACGVVPLVARHSGLAEVATELGEACFSFEGGARDLATELRRVLDLSHDDRKRLGAVARERAVTRWSWDAIGRRLVDSISG